MLRCIQLAKNGLGTTAPNPMVGCVIVHDNTIIGEGFTSLYGGAHAEVNAIRSVKDSSMLAEATLYVTLEPCSHFGKTPPCADFIIKHGIKEVVIGIQDPHSKVAGSGIKKLQENGCLVRVGIQEERCRDHHKRFLCFHEKKRPFIILKWAQTADGFMAPVHSLREGEARPFWITNPVSRRLVHQWRSEEQAILVGTNTVLKDNPKLNTRLWSGKSPIRLVLDKDLRIPKVASVFDGTCTTIVLTGEEDLEMYLPGISYRKIDFAKEIAKQVGAVLYDLNIQSVLIEGGAQTLKTFIDSQLWDEARVFTGDTLFGKGLKAPTIDGKLSSSTTIKNDKLKIIRRD